MFISKNWDVETLEQQSVFLSGVYESIYLKISSRGKNKVTVIVGNIYRPNSAPKANLQLALSTHSSIMTSIRDDHKLNKFKLILMSDFNVDLKNSETSQLTNQYLLSHLQHGLKPVIDISAHVTTSSNKIIDHIFVCSPPLDYKSGVVIFSLSDHMPTYYNDPSITFSASNPVLSSRKITSASTAIYLSLLKNLSFNLTPTDLKSLFDNLFDLITAAADLAFPETPNTARRSKSRFSPWMSRGLLISAKRKQVSYQSQFKKPTPTFKLKY